MLTQEVMYTIVLLFLSLYSILIFHKKFISKMRLLPIAWPVIGMVPELLLNVFRIFDFFADLVEKSGGTFLMRGPSFADMDMLITGDPANVQYMLSKNFKNFGKGPNFKKIFDIWGDGIFAAESVSWENQRKVSKIFINNRNFQEFSGQTMWNEVETKLIPILHSASETGAIVDLQDLFQRLAFDAIYLTVVGHDSSSLSKELPIMPLEKAFANAEEAMFYRYVMPEVITCLKKWLRIGTEKKMAEAVEATSLYMSQRMSCMEYNNDEHDTEQDMLSCYRRAVADKHDAINVSKEVWKDLSLNLLFAGKGALSAALSWFFYLLSTNPEQELYVKKEIAAQAHGERGTWSFSNIEELNKLVYLHGAVCETLRFFPPLPHQHKAPIQDDVLPSGHHVKANMNIVLSFYSMGRMKSIWGEDCMEFKPERWISDKGGIIIVPAFKFPAFSVGARTCLGKDVALTQMKIVAATIISRFTIRMAKAHSIVPRPCTSIVSHIQGGLHVKVSNTVAG